tara:strand:- start:50 stop:241 length:192 start_codon:yes stop_codon:yes gene_type:complete
MKTPQEIVVLLGGNKAAASALGVSAQAVSNWLRRGAIPYSHAKEIIQAGEERGIKISYSDLIH